MVEEGEVITDNPKQAVRYRWCGAFEGDNWKYDIFKKGFWCSKQCYEADHLGGFVFSAILFPTLSVTMLPSMFLFYTNL
jgi:hypothetical protein